MRELERRGTRLERRDRFHRVGENFRDSNRRLFFQQSMQRVDQDQIRIVGLRHRAVSALAADADVKPVHALLRDRNGERDALKSEPVGRAFATLVKRERGIDRVPMIFHHPGRAVLAAGFLVGIHHHLDAAPQRDVVALQREHRHQRHDPVRLVVDRAARPHVTVRNVGAERLMRPVGSHSRHDVRMRHQQQRFHARGSGDSRDERHHPGLALEGFGRDSLFVENRFEIRDRGGGVARRIGRVEAQISAEVIERFGIDLVPINLRRSLSER